MMRTVALKSVSPSTGHPDSASPHGGALGGLPGGVGGLTGRVGGLFGGGDGRGSG